MALLTNGIVTSDFIGVDFAYSLTIQPDGKIIAVGESSGNFALARFNQNGSLDTSFGLDGKVETNVGGIGWASSVSLQSDGKILVVGHNGADFTLARYLSNGTLDLNFGAGGLVTTDFNGSQEYAYSLAIQSDGKIVLAGGGVGDHFYLARYNANGGLDTSFSQDGKLTTNFGSLLGQANNVVIQSDGKIVVSGFGAGDFAVARYLSNGSLDNSFSGDGLVTTDFNGTADYIASTKIQMDGKIVVAGFSTINGGDFTLARYNSDGSLDTSFDNDGKVTTNFITSDTSFSTDSAYSISLQVDGKIVVAGYSAGDIAIARYNTNGSLDTTFGGDGMVTTDFGTYSAEGYEVTIQSNGKIVVAGSSNGDFALVRYNADGSLDSTFDGATSLTIPTILTVETGNPGISDNVVNEGNTAVFTVTLTAASSTTNTYSYALGGVGIGSATSADFQSPIFSSGVTLNPLTSQLNIPAGISAFTVSVPIVRDTIADARENLTLTVGNVTGSVQINEIILPNNPQQNNVLYDLSTFADMAGLSKIAYGQTLVTELKNLGWEYVDSSYKTVTLGVTLFDAFAYAAERVVDGKTQLVIAFEGTQGGADLLTDFSTFGFSNYYKALQPAVSMWINNAIAGNYDKVFITGHSLGGAAVQIAMLDLLEDASKPIWTNALGGTSLTSPLNSSERATVTDKAWLHEHIVGVTFGAPSISVDPPNSIVQTETYSINPDFGDLSFYLNHLFQFEHKSQTQVDDPVANIGSLGDNRGDELGTMIAIDLNDAISTRYDAQVGSITSSVGLDFHAILAYQESIFRALAGSQLTVPAVNSNYSDALPTLPTLTGIGTIGNDYIIPNASGASSGGAGNDVMSVRTTSTTVDGGVGHDAYVIKNYGVNAHITSANNERADELVFNLIGTISADQVLDDTSDALTFRIVSADGVSTITIDNWYSATNTYQLNSIVQINPLENTYWTSQEHSLSSLNVYDFLKYDNNSNHILGSSVSDIMNGGGGGDVIRGRGGNDNITGGAGNDYIVGGAGTDTAAYSTLRSAITEVHHLRDGGLIINGSEGIDTLISIETLSFTDGNIASSAFMITNPTPTYSTGAGAVNATRYTGPVTFLEFQMLGSATSEVVTTSIGNDFINLLGGDDAANGGLGDDVLDGGTGSNFLTGGGNNDTFFLDGRGGTTTWSTITDFDAGDQVNIWGWNAGTSRLLLTQANGGATGYTGATYHYDLNNDNTIDTSITFTGLTASQVPTSQALSVAGNGYLLIG